MKQAIKICVSALLVLAFTATATAQQSLKDRVDLAISLADGLLLKKQHSEAVEYLAFAYKYAPEVYGIVSIEVGMVQRKMGVILRDTAYLRDADIKHKQAVETYTKLYGENAKELIPLYWDRLKGRYYHSQGDHVKPTLAKIKSLIEQHYGKKSPEMAMYHFELAYQNMEFHYNNYRLRAKAAYARNQLRKGAKIAKLHPSMTRESVAWKMLLEFREIPYDDQRERGIPVLLKIEAMHDEEPLPNTLMGYVFGHFADLYQLTNHYKQIHYTERSWSLGMPAWEPKKSLYQPIETPAPNIPSAIPISSYQDTFVEIEFTVTLNGKIRDPKITASDAPEAVRAASLEAIKNFRYQPRWVDGENLIIEGMTYRLTFTPNE